MGFVRCARFLSRASLSSKGEPVQPVECRIFHNGRCWYDVASEVGDGSQARARESDSVWFEVEESWLARVVICCQEQADTISSRAVMKVEGQSWDADLV